MKSWGKVIDVAYTEGISSSNLISEDVIMKKVLKNTFVSRNYFSSPMIENLKRISIKDNIKIIWIESNLTFDK